MLQVTITNNLTGQKFQGQFDTQDEITSWITEQEAVQAWGKPERTLNALADGSVPGEDISKASSSHEITNDDGTKTTQYTFPADYTISEPQDITAQIEQQKSLALASQRRQFGSQLIDLIGVLSDKNQASPEQLQTLAATSNLSQIVFFLQTGAITTAHGLIKGITPGFFTQDQINQVLSQIEASPFYTEGA
jgi:hypothetical protein